MEPKNKKTLRNSTWVCFFILLCLSVPMFASYFFDDMFSSVSHIFKHPELLDLGWNAADFGVYAGGYSFLCVWGGLIVCGVLLDKWGVRVTGSVFVGLMVGGAALVTYAISKSFAQSGFNHWLQISLNWTKPSLTLAYIGCMLFGLGSEIAGVGVTRSIAKWFKGKNMALAMGLQLAVARLGTGLAILLAPFLVNTQILEAGNVLPFSETMKPAVVAIICMMFGVVLWSIFVALDFRFDKETRQASLDMGEQPKSDEFKFSDIFKVFKNKYWLMISLLCVFFYCCIISFKKFGTTILMPHFNITDDKIASLMLSMIPFCTLLFTPLFGALVDKRGRATTWMVIGSCLVLAAHLIIKFAPPVEFLGYVAIGFLGIGYGLVPAAMWPTVPKVIPDKILGTAYSLIYWIQNMGMLLVPLFVGKIVQYTLDNIDQEKHIAEKIAGENAEWIFVLLGIVAVTVSLLLKKSSNKNPELEIDLPNKRSKE